MAIVLSHLRCLIMYLYDQQYEIAGQFGVRKQLSFKSFKTSTSSENSGSTFLLNGKIEPNPEKQQYFLGNTFQKMKINLQMKNMEMKEQNSQDQTQSREMVHVKNSIITSSANESQVQNNIRTSYLLEKYEFSK